MHVLRAHVFYFMLFVLFLGIQRVANVVQVESAYRFVSSACIFACHSMRASERLCACVCVCVSMYAPARLCMYLCDALVVVFAASCLVCFLCW